jgi:hypothetical protein
VAITSSRLLLRIFPWVDYGQLIIKLIRTKGWRILLYGTLGTKTDTAATEAGAGVRMAMFEVYWDRFEPRQNVVSQAYAAEVEAALRAYQDAGMPVTLALDMASPPSWVFRLADSYYITVRPEGERASLCVQ